VTTPNATGAVGATKPDKLDKAATPPGGRAAAAQDGSGAVTP
jgi:hypothetical protein